MNFPISPFPHSHIWKCYTSLVQFLYDHLVAFALAAVLLNRNLPSADKLLPATIVLSSDIPTNGTVRILERASAGAVRMWSDAQKTQRVNNGQTWTVISSNEFVQTVYLEGYETSQTLEDVELQVAYVPPEGPEKLATGHLTVVETGDVTLPGAPDDGLVILKGTSIAFKVGCAPEAAGGLLSTVFQTRRLKGDGKYGDWNFAVGNYSGNTAIFTPSEGGIYQVRALVGPVGGGADERYYVWEESENPDLGDMRKGDLKSYGVCNDFWQLEVRNCAKNFLGSEEYSFADRTEGSYSFSAVPAESWKCNIFVAHRIAQCALPVPTVYRGRSLLRRWPPMANDWASDNFEIPHWLRCGNETFPEPGYVVAQLALGAHGHVGILDFDGRLISAQRMSVTRKSKILFESNHYMRKYYEEVQ